MTEVETIEFIKKGLIVAVNMTKMFGPQKHDATFNCSVKEAEEWLNTKLEEAAVAKVSKMKEKK